MRIAFTSSRLLLVVLLLGALAPNEPAYYQFLRFAVFAVCAFGVYCANRWNLHLWILAFAWLAILFNPLYPVSLPSSVWVLIDIAAAVFMIASLFFLKPKRQKLRDSQLKTF